VFEFVLAVFFLLKLTSFVGCDVARKTVLAVFFLAAQTQTHKRIGGTYICNNNRRQQFPHLKDFNT
jgi:hypothetical protein